MRHEINECLDLGKVQALECLDTSEQDINHFPGDDIPLSFATRIALFPFKAQGYSGCYGLASTLVLCLVFSNCGLYYMLDRFPHIVELCFSHRELALVVVK